MKSWVSDRRLVAGIFSLVLSFLSSIALANVGRTAGTYAVSPTGAATYTIPIWAPRGPNGLQPNISLVYDSQQGGGYVGVGWSVAGISSIYRCDLTYAQDSSPAPVALATGDGLCLDGQRLRLVSGTQGEAGSTYQTEVANFANVTAYGTAGNGPAYFVVQAPNGTRYEYGNTANSQVLAGETAFQWYLDKVTDTADNTMTFSYNMATAAVVPATISWTPTSYDATTYSYTMTFAYGTNADSSSINGYVAGTNIQNTNLLQSITIEYEGSTVKKYALTYRQSPTTGADELTNIQECADSAQTNCLAPTTVGYQDPTAGTAASATSALSSAPSQLVWHYDFSGDGFDDLAYCNSSAQVSVAFASTSGYGSPINTGIPCTGGYVLYGDLLGNGKDGILADNGGTWYYYQWNGSSFVGQSTGVAYQAATQYVLADVTGDGLPALVEMKATSTGATVYVRLNTSSGSGVSFSSTNAQWWSTTWTGTVVYELVLLESTSDGQAGNVRHLHFTGDGREDLAFQDQVETCTEQNGPGGKPEEVCVYAETAAELISTGSSFNTTLITSLRGTTAAWPIVDFLNFDSDNCTDYIYNSVIYISGCGANGTSATTVTIPSSNIIGVMDWNADKLDDILVNNGGTIGVYESTGTGLTSLISTSVPYNASEQYFAFDPYGDGLDALGAWSDASSPYSVMYYPHNGAGERPDLLNAVTDGYGNFAKPTYVSIARSNYSEGTSASYPDENYVGPLYVVNQTTFSDPSSSSGATYEQSFNYYTAWMNLWGRGFEGFGTMRTYDSRTGVYDYRYYNPAFPYTGMSTAEYYNFPTVTTRYVENTLAVKELDSTANEERYFPYVSNSTVENKELGGTENGEQIDTVSRSYTFDDYGNPTEIVTTATDNDPGSPYVGDSWTTTLTNTPDVDTSTWCLRLSSESQLSYAASNGSPSVTRTRDFTPDTTHCRYTDITTEPSSGSYEVTEALGYDDFGNIDSDAVTGVGMTARQSSANWGATGQFPMSVTDVTDATTQFNYNFSYGLVSSETDPNGLTTSWQYGDGFGRVTQESRPDGTYTTSSYSLNTGGPLTRLIIAQQPHDTAGDVITTTQFYSDMLDRPLYRTDTLLNGTQVWAKVQNYDSLGRIASSCAPYALTSTSPGCTTFSYDGLNRLTQVQRPINQSDSTLQTTSYAYAGDTSTITDPNENTRTLIKDVNGWLRQTKDAMGYAVTLGYDAAGTKTSETDSLGNTLWTGTYAYGIAPFLVGESDMDRGTWGYTVDALGERTAWTDAKGQQFYESYDALSRPLTRTEPDLFTQWTWGSSAANHNIGKLAGVCSGTGSACSSSYYSEGETYDSLGRLYQRSIAIPSMGTYTYTWQYSATTGFLNTLTYPTGSSGKALELQYAYQNGILQSITDILDSPNVTIWQADAENPAEQITQETLGNGLETNRAYDGVTGWLSSVQSGPGGGASIQNLSFLYDEVGNVTQRQDGIHDLSENVYYDNDYRLSYSALGGTQNLSMAYNAMGNITNKSTVSNNATWTYDSVHLHQVREAGSTAYEYTYDANGNMTSWASEPITWTSYNYPTQITDTSDTFTFAYAPDRSVWREVQTGGAGSTTYRLGSPLMSIVVGTSGTTDRNYIYAGNEPVAIDERKSASNTFYYLLTDHQGSISGITNSAGQVVINESFHPDGQRRNPSTWSDPIAGSDVTTIQGISPRGYTFKETLEYMNLIDFGGRVEDVFTGRFLSADPDITDPTNPQSYNRYSYTVNNPLTYTDPTGFDYWVTVYQGGPDYSQSFAPFQPDEYDVTAGQPTGNSSDSNDSGGAGNYEGSVSWANAPGENSQPQSNPDQQGGPSQNSLQTVTVTADKIPSQLVVLENETINEGSFSYFYYQLENAEGKALTGSGYGVEEHIEPSSGVHTSEGTFVPATAGVVQDVVGFADWSSGQPTSVTLPTNLLIIDDVFGQTFTVSYGGEEYDLTTVLQHQTSVVNGVVTNSVTDVVP